MSGGFRVFRTIPGAQPDLKILVVQRAHFAIGVCSFVLHFKTQLNDLIINSVNKRFGTRDVWWILACNARQEEGRTFPGRNLQQSGSEKLNERAQEPKEPEGTRQELRDPLLHPGEGLGCGRDGLQEALIETVPIGKGSSPREENEEGGLTKWAEEVTKEGDRSDGRASLFSRAGEVRVSRIFFMSGDRLKSSE